MNKAAVLGACFILPLPIPYSRNHLYISPFINEVSISESGFWT